MRKKMMSFISYFIAAPLMMLILLESLSRSSFFDTFLWMVRYPASAAVTFLLMLALIIMITSITRRHLISLWILVFAFMCFGVACGLKSSIREIPVVPSNLLLIKELFILVALVPKIAAVAVISLLVLGSAVYASYTFFEDAPLMLISRYRSAALSSSILLFIVSATLLSSFPHGENIRLVYEKYGSLSGFIHLLREPYMDLGSDIAYSPENAVKLENEWRSAKAHSSSAIRPDFIMVGAESFFDPATMNDIGFSADPVPNFRRISDKSMSGTILTNSFGANTTGTEFEVLTSMSMSYMLPDAAGFTDFFKHPVPSIPSSLKAEGYETVAIHPDMRNFLGRAKAYPMLGFDKYIDISGFKNPKFIGPYVSDHDLKNKVISEYDNFKLNNPSKPVFIYSMTCENHYDYRESWYSSDTPLPAKLPATLTKSESSMLRGYLHGVRSTDKMLGELYDYFMSQERPVVFVFWGDHLPALGKNFEVFTKCGYIANYVSNENPKSDEIQRLHSPPLLIADNFSAKSNNAKNISISPAYIGPLIYGSYGINKSPMSALLLEQSKKQPLIGLTSWDRRESINSKYTAEHRMLQYYYLFDKEKR